MGAHKDCSPPESRARAQTHTECCTNAANSPHGARCARSLTNGLRRLPALRVTRAGQPAGGITVARPGVRFGSGAKRSAAYLRRKPRDRPVGGVAGLDWRLATGATERQRQSHESDRVAKHRVPAALSGADSGHARCASRKVHPSTLCSSQLRARPRGEAALGSPSHGLTLQPTGRRGVT
jgi:hypothetical protein